MGYTGGKGPGGSGYSGDGGLGVGRIQMVGAPGSGWLRGASKVGPRGR